MNTLNISSQFQTISNTTSLSNGILKKLAITLAVSAIGVSSLVPVAYAEGEVVAQPGDTITVNEDIYGISGVFADGGTLTVKNGGISFADELREEAGSDGIISLDELFVFVNDSSNSPTAKKFKSLMGDNIDADGNMKVVDILAVVPVFDAEDDLPIADGLTRDEVFSLFTNTFGDQASPEEINNYVNQLVFDKSQNGEYVYRGFELESTPLVGAMSNYSKDDYRYRIYPLAKIADSDGNISYDDFKDILPSSLFDDTTYDDEGDADSDISFGHQLLAKFQEEATNGKISIGDLWKLTVGDSGLSEEKLENYTSFLNHAGKDLILTKAELDAAGSELGASTQEVTDFWTGVQNHADENGDVQVMTALALIDADGSANTILDAETTVYQNWNDNGRISSQNVAHVVNETFSQAEYNEPNSNQHNDFVIPNVDPQKVLTKLGTADGNGTYDAEAVSNAILAVYMEQWQIDFDESAQQNLDNILEESGSNGRISIDDYITLSGLSGTKEEAVRSLLKTTSDDNDTVSAFDAYSADGYTDFIEEIYTKTDVDSPLTVDEIIKSLPDGISSENKNAFEEQLEGLIDENGTIARETALDKLTEFVLANPGNELEQPDGGFIAAHEFGGVGIHLKSEKDLTLNNEVDIYAEDRAIVVISGNDDYQLLGNVTVINSGDLTNGGGSILSAYGKNVTVENSGELESYSDSSRNGISVGAAETVNITNTGDITVSTENESDAISTYSNGDITIDNDGDLTISGLEGNGIEAYSGVNRSPAIEGGNVKVTNSGTIRTDGDFSYAIATWSNGGKVEVINSGKLTTLQQGSIALQAYSGTNRTQNGRVVQAGDDVSFANSGDITTAGQNSWGIETSSYGGAADGVNSGEVTTKGDDSVAISISSGTNKTTNERVPLKGGAVTLNNTGTLSTQGASSVAIDIWSNGGTVNLTNEGAVTTLKDDSAGIDAYSGTNKTAGNRVVQVGDAVSVNNSGAISTAGNESSGLLAGSYGGTVDVENSGNISTKGFDSMALIVSSGNTRTDGERVPKEGSDITLKNSGVLSTEGETSDTIFAFTNGGNATITNEAKLTATGKSANGIEAYSGHEDDGEIITEGGDITINNTGEITVSGDHSIGIDTGSHGGDVKIENSGDVSAIESGITLDGSKKGELTNSGKITVKGIEGAGMSVEADDSAILINTGNVEVEGLFGMAAVALNSARVENSGEINLLGDLSNSDNPFDSAISAYSYKNASIENNADVTASGDNILGIYAENRSVHFENPEDAEEGTQLASIINSGKISTNGDGSTAISAASGVSKPAEGQSAIVGSNVTVENSGALSTDGVKAKGLAAWSNGGQVSVTNEGAITTLKETSAGIEAYSGMNRTQEGRVVQEGQAVSVTNSGVVSTAEKNSFGVFAGSYGGTVVVNNSENLSTKGDDSTGIRLSSGESKTTDGKVPRVGGALTLNNTGDVSTEGARAEALRGWTSSGDITASNEGKIVTGGEEANGIKLSSGNASENEDSKEQAGGDITLTNKGIIETKGYDVANIHTWSNGGDISITNEAKLTATGNGSEGIKAFSGHEEDGTIITAGGDITINNSGEIVASGEGSVGIESGSDGADVTIDNTADVSGSGGGIFVETSKKGEVINSGKITSTGIDGIGMFVRADDTALLTNTGNVEVEGFLGLAAGALNSASIDNSGDVSLVRNWSKPDDYWNPAIGAISANDASIKNSGKVTTSDKNMIGLYAGASDSETTKKATIENSGDVTTKGSDKAHAVYISLDGTGTLTNSGSLTTEGKTNAVVVEGKGSFTLNNTADGVIEAKNGLAIVTGDTKDTITNLGTIKGGATLAAGDDILVNKGILDGDFDFGDGKDTLTVHDYSKIDQTLFDGGAGEDIANFHEGGEFVGNKFTNFETANLLSGNFSGDVMDKFTKLVNVEKGATLSGFTKINNLTSRGEVSVDAGKTLSVNGDLKVEGGKLNLGVDSTSKHAVVNVSGDASFASTTNLFVNVDDNNSLALDESVTVLNGANVTFAEKIASTAKDAGSDFEVDDDYITYDFSGRVETTSSGKSLILTVRDSIGGVIEKVGDSFGGAITHLANLSGDKESEQNSVLTTLKSMVEKGHIAEAQDLMNEVVSSPGASQISATQNTSSFTAGNMVLNRASARTSGSFTTNLSADDSSNILGYNPEYKAAPHIRNIMSMADEGTETSIATTGYNGEIWMQVYGVHQEYGGKTSSDTDAYGGAAGIDFMIDPNSVMGLAFVYSSSDSDADTANAHTDLETDSYGVTAYGMTRFADDFKLGGALAYYWNDHDLKRQVLNNRMSANYDSNTFVARGEFGKDVEMDGYTLTPQIGGIYTHNSTDAYTEIGPLAQKMNESQTDSFIGTIGFSVNSTKDWQGMIVQPEFHVNVMHEFNDELGSFTGALAADNTVSINSAIQSTEETRFNIGGALKLNHTNVFASELAYDGIFADSTQEHLFRYKASYRY